MNKYELAVVLKPGMDEATQKAEFERIHGVIERFGGTVDKVDDWGKRRLAYEIQKQSEGVYSFITFSAEPTAPSELESRMRIMENVLRYLIIRLDEK